MPITIGSNITSLQAQRAFSNATDKVGTASERLASGMRINKASDDAAGLAISEQLNSDAKVFNQAINNVSDGISYFSIAEGAINELKNIVIRQTELAEQSANGTYSSMQRQSLDKEFQALEVEYNRLLESTSFNGRDVFSAEDGTVSIQAGYGEEGVLLGDYGSGQAATQTQIRLASISSAGIQGNDHSKDARISADGRYTVFDSTATSLTSADTNGSRDVFVYDALSGETRSISASSQGIQGNADSYDASISADGRYVAFSSAATNLVADDTNSQDDIFLHDLQTGVTSRVSQAADGSQGNGDSSVARISADGRYIAFESAASNLVTGDNNSETDIFVHDTITGETKAVSVDGSDNVGNGPSYDPSISADGRYVSFESWASDLLLPDTNGQRDIFVRDLKTGTTTRVSDRHTGDQTGNTTDSASISADGRYVAFRSWHNLVADDDNGMFDIYVHDSLKDEIKRISVSSDGVESNGNSSQPSISGDGRYVVFTSAASNLTLDDTNGQVDVFVHDLQSGATERVNLSDIGEEGSGTCDEPSISADGRYITFTDGAGNMLQGDSNLREDIVVVGNPLMEAGKISRNQWLRVDSQSEALTALDELGSYLQELNTASGQIGSIMSRFEVAAANLSSMQENYKSAEGRIIDADIAQEAADLVRTQILQQASSTVLAQANQQPSLAIQLLG